MSHYSVLVVTNTKPAERDLAAILAPWNEENPTKEAKWDWWMIGGRWSGKLDPTYDPEKDPRNIEVCNLCLGTGKRDDNLGQQARVADPSYTCNGCNGEGKRVKWPTSWADDIGNQCQVSNLPDGLEFESFAVVKDGEWFERGEMGWWGVIADEKDPEEWDKQFAQLLKDLPPTAWLTVVDCHI